MTDQLPIAGAELRKRQDENKWELILWPPAPRTDALCIELTGVVGLELAYWAKRKP
jgi:hypothetical protein